MGSRAREEEMSPKRAKRPRASQPGAKTPREHIAKMVCIGSEAGDRKGGAAPGLIGPRLLWGLITGFYGNARGEKGHETCFCNQRGS